MSVPFGLDEVVDQVTLFGRSRAEAVVIFDGQGVVVFALFVTDDFGFGVEAGFERVLRRVGLALFGFGACAVLGVGTVGRDLTFCCHDGGLLAWKVAWRPGGNRDLCC